MAQNWSHHSSLVRNSNLREVSQGLWGQITSCCHCHPVPLIAPHLSLEATCKYEKWRGSGPENLGFSLSSSACWCRTSNRLLRLSKYQLVHLWNEGEKPHFFVSIKWDNDLEMTCELWSVLQMSGRNVIEPRRSADLWRSSSSWDPFWDVIKLGCCLRSSSLESPYLARQWLREEVRPHVHLS